MILLGIMGATIPYGLCRGLGLHSSKAFFLTYILFYILARVGFPEIFSVLGDSDLGLVNLGVLVLFVVSVIKLVKFSRHGLDSPRDWSVKGPASPEIDREFRVEEEEGRALRRQGVKMAEIQLRSVEDIVEALGEIQSLIEAH